MIPVSRKQYRNGAKNRLVEKSRTRKTWIPWVKQGSQGNAKEQLVEDYPGLQERVNQCGEGEG